MIRVACEDETVYGKLERILSMPDEERRASIHSWSTTCRSREAPRDFIQAIACLLDDRVAEKAYEVVFRCQRGEPL